MVSQVAFRDNEMNFEQIIERIYPISKESKNALLSDVTEVVFPKGHRLLTAGKIESDIYFIRKGLVRAYSDINDSQVTFWFGREGDTVVSLKSYISGKPGYEHIELLENSVLYKLESSYIHSLFLVNVEIANFGKALIEQELLKTEERLISMQIKSAQQRYEELVETGSDLLQRVQLGYLASYLGITQVSLSRIRANFRH